MRHVIKIAGLALLIFHAVAVGASEDAAGTDAGRRLLNDAPPDVRLFDLHAPDLMDAWPEFLATTPMLNKQYLPAPLQDRMQSQVATYRALTPIDHPAFFVATYFDLLSERVLNTQEHGSGDIFPMRVCPVFTGTDDASVSELLAVASGLPPELFVHAPGHRASYRDLFLQTEYSHCRFLSSLDLEPQTASPTTLAETHQGPDGVQISFSVGARDHTVVVRSAEALRAVLETVGDTEASAIFRKHTGDASLVDEADVLSLARLLLLLATDNTSGYAAIPVLAPGFSNEVPHDSGALLVDDALTVAYEARTSFREIVPYRIRDAEQLHSATVDVAEALASYSSSLPADQRAVLLLQRFVDESVLLLAPAVAQK